jgi:hypothetical protein
MVDFIESKRKKHSWLSPIAIVRSIGKALRPRSRNAFKRRTGQLRTSVVPALENFPVELLNFTQAEEDVLR